MTKTSIEWTDCTWNCVRGCTRVSRGCEHCYAEGVARRFAGPGQPYEGLVRLDAKGKPKAQWNGEVRFVTEKLAEPLSWRKPRRVFVNSMSDLFHEGVLDAQIDLVLAVMLLAPQHTFQVLTKRPERMRAYLSAPDLYDRVLRAAGTFRAKRPGLCAVAISNPATSPPWWIWWGVSVEDQRTADERIPVLLTLPAAVRWVSYEPALGPVDFAGEAGIDWIVVGGESGPGARPFDLAWARSTIAQCRAAETACFFKQAGSNPMLDGASVRLLDRKGGDLAELPADLHVREWPDAS